MSQVWQEVKCECCNGRGFVGRSIEVDNGPRGSSPKWDALSEAEKRHCEFMGFDPDNPNVPLD